MRCAPLVLVSSLLFTGGAAAAQSSTPLPQLPPQAPQPSIAPVPTPSASAPTSTAPAPTAPTTSTAAQPGAEPAASQSARPAPPPSAPVYAPATPVSPPGYPPAPPGYYYTPYPPPPYAPSQPSAPPADARSHTGFFLRMGLGGGYMSDSVKVEGGALPGEFHASGAAVTFELDIGGALSPGFILAGSIVSAQTGSAELSGDMRSVRTAHDPRLTLLSALVDYYPNPKAGFHFGGLVGLAGLQVRDDQIENPKNENRGGLGIAPHVGYEFWVGNYWGLGVMGRFLYARTKGDLPQETQTDKVTYGSVLFTATYN